MIGAAHLRDYDYDELISRSSRLNSPVVLEPFVCSRVSGFETFEPPQREVLTQSFVMITSSSDKLTSISRHYRSHKTSICVPVTVATRRRLNVSPVPGPHSGNN